MTETTGLLSAMLAVQREVTTLPKDTINPAFRSKYTPLDTIVEIVTPILCTHGLVWSTLPGYADDGSPVLRYQLAHAPSGESTGGAMKLLLSKTDPQGQGSAITYARRYSLCAVLNLVADEDDDGNSASGSQRSAAKPKAKAKPAPGRIDDTRVKEIAALYKASGWKDDAAQDPHAFLRLQLINVDAESEGAIPSLIKALTVEQGAAVVKALENSIDKGLAKEAAGA